MLKPPSDVPPERLFRDLLTLPRPTRAIAYRIRGVEEAALSVVALSAVECASDPCGVIAAALRSNGCPVFSSDEEARRLLNEREAELLSADVMAALGRISPAYGRSSLRAWKSTLLEGARHPRNQRDAYALGSQIEGLGRLLIGRPERWFGVPARDLLDCHHFAFNAAREFFFECHK